MKHLLTALTAGMLLAALAPCADAGTYYVDQNHASASDGNPGTEALPLLTVDAGANRAYAGDTIIVKEGIYREAVTPARSGTAGSPITLKGAPGQRVVISGADEITGWTQCTQAIAKNNPNYANIYYVDIEWRPSQLYQDEQPVEKGKTPNLAWWLCDGGTNSTLVDAEHLGEPDDYWNGAEIFIWIITGTAQYWRTIADYDQATHTLTFDSGLSDGRMPTADRDRYYLANLVQLIDQAGQWAVENLGGGTYRVYLWPHGGGHPDNYMIEGSRRSRFIIEWGPKGYWTVENLELRHSQAHGIGCWDPSNPGHNIVQYCSIHHNGGVGIYGRFNENGLYRRNFICFNKGGISISDRGGVTVEECNVGDNWYDGVIVNSDNCTVRRSYIHGHWWWSHADNLQSWGSAEDPQSNITLEDNLIVHAGQSYMISKCENLHFNGNTIIGCGAYMVIVGQEDFFFDHNTLMLSGYGLMNTSGVTNIDIRNGLNVKGHYGGAWGATIAMGYTSDYNLFWHADGMTDGPVVWESNWGFSFDQYVAASGHDTHSTYASPQFANAPHSFYQVRSADGASFYSDRLYVDDSQDFWLLSVGDHIEVDFDGVVRTITAKGTGYIEFTPGDDRIAFKSQTMCNWKTSTDYQIDLTLQPGSPAIGLAQDGSNVGSSINVQQYMEGDFDGDWVRDIPIWPYQPPPVAEIRKWEVLADHGPAELATEFDGTTVYGIGAGVTKLRLTFGAPIDAGTVDLNSVTIVGAANGDQGGKISGITLEDNDKMMVIQLSAPLPDVDRYTITLANTVMAGDGTEVQGDKSQVLGTLAGDVDGSGDVGTADFLAARATAGRTVDETTAACDVDGSGNITTGDVRAVRARLGNALP